MKEGNFHCILPSISSITQGLNETLQRIDPQAARRVGLVREILASVKPSDTGDGGGSSSLNLADHTEPMGALTNADIDQAIYGG